MRTQTWKTGNTDIVIAHNIFSIPERFAAFLLPGWRNSGLKVGNCCPESVDPAYSILFVDMKRQPAPSHELVGTS